MVTADYQSNEDSPRPRIDGCGFIIIDNGSISMTIDLDDAEALVDRLKQILDEHPEE
jgi:hypothetical protein